jgi:hypothetical protein
MNLVSIVNDTQTFIPTSLYNIYYLCWTAEGKMCNANIVNEFASCHKKTRAYSQENWGLLTFEKQ